MTGISRRAALKAGSVAGAGLLGLGTGGGDRVAAHEGGSSDDDNDPEPVVGTWIASQHPPGEEGVSSRGFTDQTLREVAHTSVGGGPIRIRLANTFREDPVTFTAVSVGIRDEGATVVDETLQTVTFSGESTVTVRPGARAYSDPVSLSVDQTEDLVVSLYAPDSTGPTTWHTFGKDTAYVASGDAATTASGDSFSAVGASYYFLDGVDVVAPDVSGAVVALGDSITDGVGSTVNPKDPTNDSTKSAGPNNAYPDYLAERITAESDVQLSALNAGISGNRILHDSPSEYNFGPNALARLDRDVLAQTGVTDVILLEGINDIGFSASEDLAPAEAVTAEQITDGMSQIVRRCRAKGLRVFGGTLTPFKGADYYYPEGEAKRQAVNEFVRTSGVFDGVFDFDKALQDPSNPKRLLPKYDSGDHLHPSDAGYQKMAQTVELDALGARADSQASTQPQGGIAGD